MNSPFEVQLTFDQKGRDNLRLFHLFRWAFELHSTQNMARLPADSLVVVTGANGFVGGHIVDQLLLAGFKVRGTVREASKGAWIKEYADKTHGPGKFEVFVVPDMVADGAFDGSVKGDFLLLKLPTTAADSLLRCLSFHPYCFRLIFQRQP